jgi:N-methylhydantoinase B
VIVIDVAGGGGYGDPLDRDPEMVQEDVIQGYVSLEKAKEDYGVVIDTGTLMVDTAATEELRRSMRA